MVRYTLHVPMNDNSGAALRDVHHTVALDLATSFGGFTAVRGEGAWQGAGRFYSEPFALYSVDTEDTSDAYARLHALATRVKLDASQEAVYLTRQQIETFLI